MSRIAATDAKPGDVVFVGNGRTAYRVLSTYQAATYPVDATPVYVPAARIVRLTSKTSTGTGWFLSQLTKEI